MPNRAETARELFEKGYNCAQTMVLTFSDIVPVDEKTLLKLASPFGGGMGRMRQVCGALSGMYIILGLLEGYDTPDNGPEKKALYEKVQSLAEEFREKNGSILCSELLGEKGKDKAPKPDERTREYYESRPCTAILERAAQIFENYLL